MNIAELLKDCPSGMELDCMMFKNVFFDCVTDNPIYPIRLYVQSEKDSITLTSFGCTTPSPYAKCVIFPKGKTTWEGFQRPFKDGDILISGLEDNPFIFKRINGLGNAQCYCAISCFGQLILNNDNWTCIKGCRLATEEEKRKLFDAIKENGYKWNPETKTLENLPKFKVGDRVQNKNTNMIGTINLIINDEREYRVSLKNGGITYILFEFQDNWELVKDNSKPKFKVGDRITKRDSIVNSWIVSSVSPEYYGLQLPKGSEGIGVLPVVEQDDWVLVPNKFDITTLKPFDKVLVRDHNAQEWVASLFSNYNEPKKYKYICVNGSGYAQCIPYEGNEHLLGTKNDCDDYHKTWE